MFFTVLQSPVTLQIHAGIFAQENRSSTGKVCPTARFEKHTPANKGPNEVHTIKKDGLARE
jgi:hypothetical protein